MKISSFFAWYYLTRKRTVWSYVYVLFCCIIIAFLVTNKDALEFLSTGILRERIVFAPKKQCYVHNHVATENAPYTVHEYIELTQQSDGSFAGIKRGTQSGPDMTNGYEGVLGALAGYPAPYQQMHLVFDYVVEGSRNRELEIYTSVRGPRGKYGPGSEIGLNKLRYPLVEREGILVPDTSQKYTIQRYASVVCDKESK